MSAVPTSVFPSRHIGSTATATQYMLDTLGYPSLDALFDAAVPQRIRGREVMNLTRVQKIGLGYPETIILAVLPPPKSAAQHSDSVPVAELQDIYP